MAVTRHVASTQALIPLSRMGHNVAEERPSTAHIAGEYLPCGGFIGDSGAGGKTAVLSSVISRQVNVADIRSILVVGCGDGSDARSLAQHFGCRVTAIDLQDYFEISNKDKVTFIQMSACNMEFEDSSFSFVYSFHALEHIPDYKKAISEIRRVLKPGGGYCIGTPNRARVVGYVGVPDYSLMTKIRANATDWAIRLKGKFRNEFGAHAGYTARELVSICNAIGPGRDVSNEYYLELYARWRMLLKIIIFLGLHRFAWPSVYIVGAKP